MCRRVLVTEKNLPASFDAASIWKRICELPLERLHTFIEKLWIGIRDLWKRKTDGKFTVSNLLDKAIFPALLEAGSPVWNGSQDPFTDAYDLIAASWDSLGRPDRAEGLAVPIVRLARLLCSAATTFPLYLTDLPRTTRLIWDANACLGLTEKNISWDTIMAASRLGSGPHFPLLHLYTALISQSIAHGSGPQQTLPNKRHELMNLVVEKCCTKVGGNWFTSKPSNAFKDSLVFVFQELWKYQHEYSRLSLRGHAGEEAIVKGIWAIVGWPIRSNR